MKKSGSEMTVVPLGKVHDNDNAPWFCAWLNGQEFANEKAFKNAWLEAVRNSDCRYGRLRRFHAWAIENLEEPGMPDTLLYDVCGPVTFVEFKFVRNGAVKFEPTQLLWCRNNSPVNAVVGMYFPKHKRVAFVNAGYFTLFGKTRIGVSLNEDADTVTLL